MKKKSFYLFYSAFAFLFCFQVQAGTPAEVCKYVFKGMPGKNGHNLTYYESVLYVRPSKDETPKTFSQEGALGVQSLINYIPYTAYPSTSNLGRLEEGWKNQILELLPQFEKLQLLSLFDKLAILSKQLDLAQERVFFRSLEEASLKFIVDFNKRQLADMLWIFIQLDMKPPQDEFIHLWRKTAEKKKREFTTVEEHGLYGFLQRLGVPARVMDIEEY